MSVVEYAYKGTYTGDGLGLVASMEPCRSVDVRHDIQPLYVSEFPEFASTRIHDGHFPGRKRHGRGPRPQQAELTCLATYCDYQHPEPPVLDSWGNFYRCRKCLKVYTKKVDLLDHIKDRGHWMPRGHKGQSAQGTKDPFHNY